MKKNMKRYFEALERELDERIPPLSDELRDTPLPAPRDSAGKRRGAPPRRKPIAALSAALAAVVLLCAVLPFALLHNTQSAPEVSVVAFSAEPLVLIATDEEDNVAALFSENGDGDVLLSDESFAESLIDRPVCDAVAALADYARSLGYFSADKTLSLTVANDSSAHAQALAGQLRDAVSAFPLTVRTLSSAAFAAERGISAANGKELFESVFSRTSLLFDRKSETLSDEDFSGFYASELIGYYARMVAQAYRTMAEKKELLAVIDEQNERVAAHPDNPSSLLGKDYWDLTDRTDLSAALQAEMTRMTDLLAEYERRFDQTLNSASFRLLFGWYSVLDLDRRFERMNDLISSYFSRLVGIAELTDFFFSLFAEDDALTESFANCFSLYTEEPSSREEGMSAIRRMYDDYRAWLLGRYS